MFIVNGSDRQGIKTSQHTTLEEALAKASDFIDAGMFNVTILDVHKKLYLEAEIDLLLEIVRAERRRSDANATSPGKVSDTPKAARRGFTNAGSRGRP